MPPATARRSAWPSGWPPSASTCWSAATCSAHARRRSRWTSGGARRRCTMAAARAVLRRARRPGRARPSRAGTRSCGRSGCATTPTTRCPAARARASSMPASSLPCATLAQRMRGETLAVVTHGGVLDMLWRTAHGLPLNGPRECDDPEHRHQPLALAGGALRDPAAGPRTRTWPGCRSSRRRHRRPTGSPHRASGCGQQPPRDDQPADDADEHDAARLSQSPAFIICGRRTSPVPKTMALGGVPTGIMNAQLAADRHRDQQHRRRHARAPAPGRPAPAAWSRPARCWT